MKKKPWIDGSGIVYCVIVAVWIILSIPPEWSLHRWYYDDHAQIPHVKDFFTHDCVSDVFDWVLYQLIELWNTLFSRDVVLVLAPWVAGAIGAGILGKIGSDWYSAIKKDGEESEK